ncbi:MAG: VanW family protein [Sandaracinaceae bacterium]
MSRPLQLGLGCAALLLLSPFAAWATHLAVDGPAPGLRLGGEPLGEMSAIDARAERWDGAELRVEADGTFHGRARRALGAQVDRAATRRRIAGYGRSGDPLSDLRALATAFMGRADLDWTVRVDPAPAAAFVESLAHEVDRPARPAELDGRGGVARLSADGARLDREAAAAELVRALEAGRLAVSLPVTVLPSGVGEAALPPVPAARRPVLIARYATDYTPRERDRSHNLAVAARALDGATVAPHGQLSFNDQVGARSRDAGYREAHVIVDGEMVDGLGGGVCQVASTLHAAAFLGGLDVIDHVPHSRPSAYIPMGLDATVVWPNVDLVLANPFPFPVTVRAWAEDGRMVVELFGRERPREVQWERRVIETEPWGDRYVEDAAISPGEQQISQRPIQGFLVLRSRTLRGPAGIRLEERRLRYPPTDRILRVAPGTLDPLTGEPRVDGPRLPPNPF